VRARRTRWVGVSSELLLPSAVTGECRCRLGQPDLSGVGFAQSEGHPVDAAFSYSSLVRGPVRRAEPGCRWRCPVPLLALAGDGTAVQPGLRTLDVGVVPADVHLRPGQELDAVASRFLAELAIQTPVLSGGEDEERPVPVEDDTIIEVHGYSGVRGLNALLATRHRADGAGDRGATGTTASSPRSEWPPVAASGRRCAEPGGNGRERPREPSGMVGPGKGVGCKESP
jgi:hypothetical protein